MIEQAAGGGDLYRQFPGDWHASVGNMPETVVKCRLLVAISMNYYNFPNRPRFIISTI